MLHHRHEHLPRKQQSLVMIRHAGDLILSRLPRRKCHRGLVSRGYSFLDHHILAIHWGTSNAFVV